MSKKGFILLESIIIAVMLILTFLEIYYFKGFSLIFNYIKDYASWFIALSFSTVFSNAFQNISLLIASKTVKGREENSNKDFFFVFVASIVIVALISPFVKQLAVFFFTNFFIYFHVIFLQWMILLYLFFKVKNRYEISGAYFLTNELIVLVNIVAVLYFIA
jgi:hypothetical protein